MLDVLRGRAVHAVGGNRAHYEPVQSVLHPDSDPLGLARAFAERLGLRTVYLADLDAIAGAAPAVALYRALNASGIDCWVDSGLRHGQDLERLVGAGVSTFVAGSETLAGPDVLDQLLARLGPERLLFSLDLRRGRPVLASGARWADLGSRAVAAEAVRRGVRRVLLLDLARVGSGGGLGTLSLVEELAGRDGIEIVVGGGIAGRRDLEEAARAGASAVLVGTALHCGRLTVSAGTLVECTEIDTRRSGAERPPVARLSANHGTRPEPD